MPPSHEFCCLTSTEARRPIRDGDEWEKGDRRVKPPNRRQPGRPRLPSTAARTTAPRNRCPICYAEQSHKDNVRSSAVGKQLKQKKSYPLSIAQCHLPALDLFWASFFVSPAGLFFELPCDTQNDTNCKKLLVCALYIPPEGSVYSIRSSFTELEETLLHINLDNVLIMGDLNARTGDSSDYIWDTAALDNVLDDVSTTEIMKMYNIQ